MNKYIEIFKNFLHFDKEFVDDLIPRFHNEMELLGRFIEEHRSKLYCSNKEELSEFIDFIDGNGFKVIRPENLFSNSTHPIELIPIYTEEIEEIENINEKVKETIKKLQSALSEYVPVQETVLSYTSMETNQRYILEYEKLLASWAFWLCVCRRVELLRLVPEGRCGSTAIPRPP